MYRRDHEKRKKFHEMIIPAGQPSLRSLYRDRFRAVMTLPHLMRGGLRILRYGRRSQNSVRIQRIMRRVMRSTIRRSPQ